MTKHGRISKEARMLKMTKEQSDFVIPSSLSLYLFWERLSPFSCDNKRDSNGNEKK